jgi:hypothetical protein
MLSKVNAFKLLKRKRFEKLMLYNVSTVNAFKSNGLVLKKLTLSKVNALRFFQQLTLLKVNAFSLELTF